MDAKKIVLMSLGISFLSVAMEDKFDHSKLDAIASEIADRAEEEYLNKIQNLMLNDSKKEDDKQMLPPQSAEKTSLLPEKMNELHIEDYNQGAYSRNERKNKLLKSKEKRSYDVKRLTFKEAMQDTEIAKAYFQLMSNPEKTQSLQINGITYYAAAYKGVGVPAIHAHYNPEKFEGGYYWEYVYRKGYFERYIKCQSSHAQEFYDKVKDICDKDKTCIRDLNTVLINASSENPKI